MRETTPLEKALASAVDAGIALIVVLPVAYLYSWTSWRIGAIATFSLLNVCSLTFNNGRSPGMMAVKSYWKEPIQYSRHLLYFILYALSFSTMFIWVWFPFDLFLANMLLLQLPTILLTGTTLHGYLSGGLVTVVRV